MPPVQKGKPPAEESLLEAVRALGRELSGWREEWKHEAAWRRSQAGLVTKTDLKEMENRIMEAIQAFATRVNVRFDELSDTSGQLKAGVEGIADDVAFLKEEIAKLKTSPGELSAEDQATLDGIEARLGTLSTNLATMRDQVKTLDDATSRPPTPGA